MAITTKATISAEMYSYLACPKGCSLSAGFAESLNPKRVTAEEPKSERLLTASAITVTDPLSIPAKSLSTKSTAFMTIPMIPAVIP